MSTLKEAGEDSKKMRELEALAYKLFPNRISLSQTSRICNHCNRIDYEKAIIIRSRQNKPQS